MMLVVDHAELHWNRTKLRTTLRARVRLLQMQTRSTRSLRMPPTPKPGLDVSRSGYRCQKVIDAREWHAPCDVVDLSRRNLREVEELLRSSRLPTTGHLTFRAHALLSAHCGPTSGNSYPPARKEAAGSEWRHSQEE